MAFEANLADLLESDSEVLNIDMIMVGMITSQYIGQLAAFSQAAKDKGKVVRFITSSKIANVLNTAGLNNLAEVIAH